MQDMHEIEGLEYCLEQVNSTNTEYGCRVRQVPTRALLTPRDRPESQPVRHCLCTRDQFPPKKPPFRLYISGNVPCSCFRYVMAWLFKVNGRNLLIAAQNWDTSIIRYKVLGG